AGGILSGPYSSLTLDESTVSLNHGVFNAGGILNAGTLTIKNSTIAGNDAYAFAGILHVYATATIEQSMISGNTATAGPGGGIGIAGIYAGAPPPAPIAGARDKKPGAIRQTTKRLEVMSQIRRVLSPLRDRLRKS